MLHRINNASARSDISGVGCISGQQPPGEKAAHGSERMMASNTVSAYNESLASPSLKLNIATHRSVRRKSPQKARQKPSPIPPPPIFPIHRLRRIPPARILPCRTQLIGHELVLHHVRRVAREPKDLRGESAGPEVDCGRGERGVRCEVACEDFVGAPPECEESAEEEGCGEAMEEAAETVMCELEVDVSFIVEIQDLGGLYWSYKLLDTVDWAFV